jgi:hypothetical protein
LCHLPSDFGSKLTMFSYYVIRVMMAL